MSKKRILCPQLPDPHRPVPLSESEATHAVRVLRLRDGDTVEAIDGQGHAAPAILRLHGGNPRLEVPAIVSASRAGAAGLPMRGLVRTEAPDAIIPLVLEMAVLKGDAMGWVVEKAVELGVTSLLPVLTDHTIVQVRHKGPEAFRDRWQKIADQALKQCGRLGRMRVELTLPLRDVLGRKPDEATGEVRFWADEASAGLPAVAELSSTLDSLFCAQPGRSPDLPRQPRTFRLLIGPEGGWSAEERELLERTAGSIRIGLGPLILRAETAAILGIGLIAARYRASTHHLTKMDGPSNLNLSDDKTT